MILNQSNVLPYVKMEKFTMKKLHLVNQQEIVKMEKFGMKNQTNAKLMIQKIIIRKIILQAMTIKNKKMIHMILLMEIMEKQNQKTVQRRKNMKENVKEA